MLPVSSAKSENCYLVSGNNGSGVTALQNALAFTNYDLRRGLWEYAGLLNGGSPYLSAHNWGIDGKFGTNTYKALRAFQEDARIGVDGKYGNETYSKLEFGEDHLTDGYKWVVSKLGFNGDGHPVYAY
jgi:peptidoglycan hydrolase-like protein with peptidoglycan-binding domain